MDSTIKLTIGPPHVWKPEFDSILEVGTDERLIERQPDLLRFAVEVTRKSNQNWGLRFSNFPRPARPFSSCSKLGQVTLLINGRKVASCHREVEVGIVTPFVHNGTLYVAGRLPHLRPFVEFFEVLLNRESIPLSRCSMPELRVIANFDTLHRSHASMSFT